jgi:hypothetical protein
MVASALSGAAFCVVLIAGAWAWEWRHYLLAVALLAIAAALLAHHFSTPLPPEQSARAMPSLPVKGAAAAAGSFIHAGSAW